MTSQGIEANIYSDPNYIQAQERIKDQNTIKSRTFRRRASIAGIISAIAGMTINHYFDEDPTNVLAYVAAAGLIIGVTKTINYAIDSVNTYTRAALAANEIERAQAYTSTAEKNE